MKYRDSLEYALFRGLIGVPSLFGTRRAEHLLVGLARLARRLPAGRGDVVSRQLAAVYPDRTGQELAGMAKRVYDHLGRTVAEIFCADPAELAARVRVEPGWGPLDLALARGRGVIVATGHIGNFELGGRILAGRYSLLDVIKPQRNALFDRYLAERRREHGIRTVPMDRCAGPVLAQLRRGGVVSLLLDQDAGSAGLATEFLGLPASTWPGAARFALRTGCPVVPMAILRQPDGGHVLHIGPPLQAVAGEDRPDEVMRLTTAISAAVERFIHLAPEQWFWVHRRWKGADPVRSTS